MLMFNATPSIPKWLSLFLDFLVPKMIVQFLYDLSNDIKKTFDIGLDIRGTKSNIFEGWSHHQEDFQHRNFWGCFGVVVIFYFEHHTYNYLDNSEHALISTKLENMKIFLGRREYEIPHYIHHLHINVFQTCTTWRPRPCRQCICLTKFLQVFFFWHAKTCTKNKCTSIDTHILEVDTYCDLWRGKTHVNWHTRN